MDRLKVRMNSLFVFAFLMIFSVPCFQGYTYEQDVFAINDLYINLGMAPLPGWRIGGDPCLEAWQGVQCVNSNITGIILNGANLGGQLSSVLGNFTSIITIDLGGNHIGGSIPENLPLTMRKFFLSDNQFTGTIPASLSNLTLLTDVSLNNNLLTGELPDAFQPLTGLVNLDLSFNNLSGQLPTSMGSLSSLTTLHVENNQLVGTLNVLESPPLIDLNIENNMFSGPIPAKLLTIPNFKKDGNPFNISSPPSPAPALSPLPLPGAPTSDSPSSRSSASPAKNHKNSITRVSIYSAIAVASLIVAMLLIVVCIAKCRSKKLKHEGLAKTKKEIGRPKEPMNSEKLIIQNNNLERRVAKDNLVAADVTAKLSVPTDKIQMTVPQNQSSPAPVSSFSVATLQQFTNSFGEENLIRNVKLGKIYLAELSNGKLLTVMNIENVNPTIPVKEFLDVVSRISRLRHPNILELVGYCAEFDQRLLVYSYYSSKTLHDILHNGDNINKKLSWNARVLVALGAARALEYLHEGCRPPVVHENFESANILVDDGLAVRVSDCGLASLMISNSAAQGPSLSNCAAPEVSDHGLCTDKGDVYSFGVVMLELLTGRKPYDSSRPQEERYIVSWASPQLYDLNALSRMVDPSIAGKFHMKSLSRFADIINRCIQQGPEFRPPMSEVVQDLSCMIEDAATNRASV